jgi:hypothetical protein
VPGQCSFNLFCAYHGNFSNNGNEYLYANMYDAGTDPGCQGGGSPNNDQAADTEISISSHEMSEAISDPEPNNAWTDFSTNDQYGLAGEIGDMCAYIFNGNTPLNNGHQYSIQEEWSNFDGDCVHGDTINTSLQYTGPTSANPGDTVTLSATFQDSNGLGVGEQTIVFTLGSQSCSGTTDFAVPGTSQGHASCSITLNQNPGAYTVTAQYKGGLGAYQVSSTSASFSINQINQKATNLTYTGATSGDYNDAATVSAQLTDATTHQGVANESLTFTLNSNESCTGTTDTNGNASCQITPHETAGTYQITASFGGDSTYTASNVSGTFAVNGCPRRGRDTWWTLARSPRRPPCKAHRPSPTALPRMATTSQHRTPSRRSPLPTSAVPSLWAT